MNTMADLRRECASRLRETLHGREVEDKNVTTAHMLGIVPIGVRSNNEVEEGTLLDCKHEFWQNFEDDVKTKNGAKRRIESAIRSLKKDDIFRMTYPYGEEWQDPDIAYCEVDELGEAQEPMLPTKCAECGHTIEAPLSLNFKERVGSYTVNVEVDCPHCDFKRFFESALHRQ